MTAPPDTHSKTIGYPLWIFGFMGAHRLLTGGLLLLGVLYDYWTLNGQVDEANRGAS